MRRTAREWLALPVATSSGARGLPPNRAPQERAAPPDDALAPCASLQLSGPWQGGVAVAG